MAITLTPKSIEMIRHYRKEQNLGPEYHLRVGVKGGGCNGLEYVLGFDDAATDDDEIVKVEEIAIRVDKKSFLTLNGVEIDYVDNVMQRGFKFNNPNASSTCGCGSSFAV